MEKTEQINQEVIKLWVDLKPDDHKLMPLIYAPLNKGGLLFVGLNPSFGTFSFLKGAEDPKCEKVRQEREKFYAWKNKAMFDIELAQKIEKIAIEKHPYFEKFRRIARHAKLNFAHIDLFFYRETSQHELKRIICDDGKLNEFGVRQLMLSTQLMSDVQPRVILVANAFASHVFLNNLRHTFNMKFADDLGCHTIQLNGRTVPTFLASMLSGQRAMDRFSFRRLDWHIRWVLQKN